MATREEIDYATFREEMLKNPEVKEAYDKMQSKYDLIAKRIEINKLLKLWADDRCLFEEKTCEHRGVYSYCCSEDESLKCLKERLTEQGVVIRVERECGVCVKGFTNSIPNGSSTVCPRCYGKYQQVAIESLI
ncbi:hypothetical protein LCGC14_0420480 [marine sediment metagenome]|uniref:Uncharacterized protein n=1 Tax=marine sediment metagenome TaxID=412755 RepID=A0A0F9SX45_9ZZZZ